MCGVERLQQSNIVMRVARTRPWDSFSQQGGDQCALVSRNTMDMRTLLKLFFNKQLISKSVRLPFQFSSVDSAFAFSSLSRMSCTL